MLSYTLRILLAVLVVGHVEVLGSVYPPPRVSTKQGHFTGIRQRVICADQRCTRTIYKFLGIPFAQRPRRFKPPKPIPVNRSRQHDATLSRSYCVQKAPNNFGPVGSEDCLYLNIYTPFINGSLRYPVIVFIHGGKFASGSPTYLNNAPGEYLPLRDVVFVTIQYRLGPFGFFMVKKSKLAPGNVGLLDQVMALRWIQQNIGGFGGDKNSVTLLGESAGGSSVGYHYLSRRSRGLFHRGIAVSGVDLEVAPLVFKPRSAVRRASTRLLKNMKCKAKGSSVDKQVSCLRKKHWSEIMRQSTKELLDSLVPTVDKRFLVDSPRKLRKSGNFQKLPLMAGFTSQDGLRVVDHILQKQAVSGHAPLVVNNVRSFTTVLTTTLVQDLKLTQRKYIDLFIGAVKYNYHLTPVPGPPTADPPKLIDYKNGLVNIFTDLVFAAPIHAALSFHSDHNATAYMFEFAHPPGRAIHGVTKTYELGKPLLTPQSYNIDDRNVSDTMITMFTNFAKFGNPTPSPVHGVQWQPFTSSTNKSYLRIQRNPVMASNYRPMSINFFNDENFTRLLQETSSTKRSHSAEPKTIIV